MESQNVSDMIEKYLKQVLADNEQVEIRRVEMAHLFNCVPSQINYVINTRFTVQQGYVVESKRGGGGYIRIMKVRLTDESQRLMGLDKVVGNAMTENEAFSVLQKMYEENLITKREGNLLLSVMQKQVLQSAQGEENYLRAKMMRSFLKRLSYEEEG